MVIARLLEAAQKLPYHDELAQHLGVHPSKIKTALDPFGDESVVNSHGDPVTRIHVPNNHYNKLYHALHKMGKLKNLWDSAVYPDKSGRNKIVELVHGAPE